MDEQNKDKVNNLPEADEVTQPEKTSSSFQPEPIASTPAVAVTEGKKGFWREALGDKKLFWALGGVVVLAALAGLVVYLVVFNTKPMPPAPEVVLQVEQPSRIVAGQQFDFTIDYSNRSNQTLKNLSLEINQPSGFTFKESDPAPADNSGKTFKLPDLNGGQAGKVKITATLDGQISDTKDFDILLHYQLPRVSGTYTSENKLSLQIGSPDLVLILNGPADTTVGQENIYSVTYRNISTDILRDVLLTLITPPEFRLNDVTPSFTNADQHSWNLGDLAPGKEGSLKVTGVFAQTVGQDRSLEVDATKDKTSDIISRAFTISSVESSPLTVSQSVQVGGSDNVQFGQSLSYHITITNNGDTALTNLIVSADLSRGPYDFSNLHAPGGVLADNTITWTSGGIESLKLLRSQNTVTIDFNLPLLQSDNYFGPVPVKAVSSVEVTSFELKQPIFANDITLNVSTSTPQ